MTARRCTDKMRQRKTLVPIYERRGVSFSTVYPEDDPFPGINSLLRKFILTVKVFDKLI